MPKKVTPLSDTTLRAVKPKEKDYKLFDGDGLYLFVKKTGAKLWRMKYYNPITKKENSISFGAYPQITLQEARTARDKARKQLKEGTDPMEERKGSDEETKKEIELQKSQIHLVFYEWASKLENKESVIQKKIRLFETALFPYFCTYDKNHQITSSRQIKEITHNEILKAVDEKKKTANETSRRLLGDCRTLWNYAIAYGYTDRNIIDIIPKSEKPKKITNNYPKITDEKILANLIRDSENYKGHPIIRNALRLIPYVMLRAENLTTLKWEYVDFEKKMITIPRSQMKVKDKNLPDFRIPLTDKAVQILNDIKPFTGWSEWVFHAINKSNNPLNPASINKALKIMGYNDEAKGTKQTIHSFRGTFRSLSDTHLQEHNMPFEIRERCLDHNESNSVVRAYTHKADYTRQMRELLEWWERYLEKIIIDEVG